MTILNFNDIEWKNKEEIKAEIDKIVYMLGGKPTNDLNKLRKYKDPKLNLLIRRYEKIV
mgnify:CR=1 FL=1